MLGGLWMVRIGINRGLWLFGVVQMVSILGFAWLAWENRPDKALLAGVIAFEALGVGLGTAAFVAYIARATDPRYTATQYALFTSLAAVPRTVINAATGWIVEQTGWFAFFLLCAALALPGMALLLRVAPWNERGKDEQGRGRP
jgi:PAT family beta-lactamase induction signal transducer AmpG